MSVTWVSAAMLERPGGGVVSGVGWAEGGREGGNTRLNLFCVDHCDCGRGEVAIVVMFPTVDINSGPARTRIQDGGIWDNSQVRRYSVGKGAEEPVRRTRMV